MECQQCHKSFTPKWANANRPRKFCSRECMGRSNHEQTMARRRNCLACGQRLTKSGPRKCCSTSCAARWMRESGARRRLRQVICPVCQEVFRPLKATTAFCSRRCKDAAHSVLMGGANNPSYVDGLEYRKKFKRIISPRLRLEFAQCIECGTTKRLICHHLDENHHNDILTNIAVLCRACHLRFHTSKNAELRQSMTFKWQKIVASLLKDWSSTTAS